MLYIENSKDATRKLLELINEFGKGAGYKINTKKSLGFLYTNNKSTAIPTGLTGVSIGQSILFAVFYCV